MSRKRHRCPNGGKTRYRDQAEARRALRKFAARSTREKFPVRAYFCAACRGWHLTSRAEWRES